MEGGSRHFPGGKPTLQSDILGYSFLVYLDEIVQCQQHTRPYARSRIEKRARMCTSWITVRLLLALL